MRKKEILCGCGGRLCKVKVELRVIRLRYAICAARTYSICAFGPRGRYTSQIERERREAEQSVPVVFHRDPDRPVARARAYFCVGAGRRAYRRATRQRAAGRAAAPPAHRWASRTGRRPPRRCPFPNRSVRHDDATPAQRAPPGRACTVAPSDDRRELRRPTSPVAAQIFSASARH